MVERTDELRDDIERRRQNISHTVDELQNRVSPGRIMARVRNRVRRWIINTRDQIMGNEEPYYPWQQGEEAYSGQQREYPGSIEKSVTDRVSQAASEAGDRVSHAASEIGDRMSEATSAVKEAVTEAPEQIRQQTRGNPIAAGLIAFGGGLLLGTILPGTRTERDIAHRIEQPVSSAVAEAREVASDVRDDVKEDAEHAMEEVKKTASEAGEHLKDDAKDAAERTRDTTQSS